MPKPSSEDVLRALKWAQEHPVEWMQQSLGFEPWGKQREIAESVRDNPRTAVRSCHGIGKSAIAARIGLWFNNAFPSSLVASTAPTFRQVQKILWQEWAKASASAKTMLLGRQLKTEYIIAPGWFAFGFSSDDPNAAQGLHAENLLLIYDEASGIPPDTCEALEGALTSTNTRLLQIGNPTDINSNFAKEFKSKGTAKFAISAFDTPNFTSFGITLDDIASGDWVAKVGGRKMPMPWLITPEWVADKVTRWGIDSPAFKARILAKFPELGDDTLFPLAWIEAAMARDLDPAKTDIKQLIVDVARFGADENVIGTRHGPQVRIVDAYRGLSTMETAGRVMKWRKELGIKGAVKVDETGVGGGPVDRLRELKVAVQGLNAGSSALDPSRFVNARAEWFWNLREAAEHGVLDLPERDEDLLGQLTNMKFKYTSAGKIQIESKAEMKARGLGSPDRADMAAMAFAPTVTRKGHTLIQAMQSITD